MNIKECSICYLNLNLIKSKGSREFSHLKVIFGQRFAFLCNYYLRCFIQKHTAGSPGVDIVQRSR